MSDALPEPGRRKDERLAALSHELRNGLAAMRTAVDVLRDAGDAPAIAEQAQGILTRQLARLTRVAEDLLELSRTEETLPAQLSAPNGRHRAP